MKTMAIQRRWLAGLLIAGTALAATAPLAEAGHAYGRRYRGPAHETRVVRGAYGCDGGYAPRRTYIARRSSSGPALAGFFGGLVLGAALADRASSDVVYRDPYCHEDFSSLEIYASHCRSYHHPRTWSVIEVNGDHEGGRDRYDDRYDRRYRQERDDRWNDGGDDEDDD